jgi:SAM-dependent methyltransferase
VAEDSARERSLRFLEEQDLRYQAISLPGGVSTPGHDRSYLEQVVFGDDFQGQSLLDIGSYLGHFCIEALRRGAAGAVGIETDPRNHRQARAIAEMWELSPEYILGDFEEWDPGERRFDVVACLNVLHHLFDPIHALRKMERLARSRVVLEVAVPSWRDVARDGISPLRLAHLGAPAVYLGVPRKRGDAAGRTFLFTPQALRILFNVHTSVFEPIRVTRSPFKRGRMLVEARKRRVGHLVVVAGPTAVGKSTFVRRLQSDAKLRAELGLEAGEFEVTQAAAVRELAPGPRERLLLHYDFLRPSRTGMRSHGRDPDLRLFEVAERITVVTLMAPAATLRTQLEASELRREGRQRDLDLLESYRREEFLRDWYAGWVGFCARHADRTARHALVVNEGEYRVLPIEAWSRTLAACHAG